MDEKDGVPPKIRARPQYPGIMMSSSVEQEQIDQFRREYLPQIENNKQINELKAAIKANPALINQVIDLMDQQFKANGKDKFKLLVNKNNNVRILLYTALDYHGTGSGGRRRYSRRRGHSKSKRGHTKKRSHRRRHSRRR